MRLLYPLQRKDSHSFFISKPLNNNTMKHLLEPPAKIFLIIDRLVEKADQTTQIGHEITTAISNRVPNFQIIQTIKKQILKNRTLMVEIIGADLVTDISKY